jgi:hypothetical protein
VTAFLRGIIEPISRIQGPVKGLHVDLGSDDARFAGSERELGICQHCFGNLHDRRELQKKIFEKHLWLQILVNEIMLNVARTVSRRRTSNHSLPINIICCKLITSLDMFKNKPEARPLQQL